jgi:hypothetical protein
MGEPVSSVASSQTLTGEGHPPPAKPARHSVTAAWLSAATATLLILCELLALDAVLAWAAGALLALSSAVVWIAAAVGAVAVLWLAFGLFRTALANELRLLPPTLPDV